mgnify:CR=1 FL=1
MTMPKTHKRNIQKYNSAIIVAAVGDAARVLHTTNNRVPLLAYR